jgi:ribosomal protein S18 acetylase RimI-like enzyme
VTVAEIALRRGTEADVRGLTELSKRCFAVPWRRRDFADELQLAGGEIWLAETPLALLGYLVVRRMLDPTGRADELEVLSLGVDSSGRRRGVAGTLLERAVRRSTSPTLVHLEVREGNHAARASYRTLQFEEV